MTSSFFPNYLKITHKSVANIWDILKISDTSIWQIRNFWFSSVLSDTLKTCSDMSSGAHKFLTFYLMLIFIISEFLTYDVEWLKISDCIINKNITNFWHFHIQMRDVSCCSFTWSIFFRINSCRSTLFFYESNISIADWSVFWLWWINVKCFFPITYLFHTISTPVQTQFMLPSNWCFSKDFWLVTSYLNY